MIALFLGSGLAAPAPRASAQTAAADARALHLRGEEAYLAGRYEEAVDLWLRACALEPRPDIFFNLAQAYGRLGQLPEERRALERYLEGLHGERLEEAHAESARQRIAAIEERLLRTGIVLRGVPAGASVILDGARTTPFEGLVSTEPGSHSVRIELDGFEPFEATATVVAGARAEIPVALEPEIPDPPAPHEDRRHRGLAIGLGGAGGGVLVAGAVLGGIAAGRARGSFEGSEDARRAHGLAIGADVLMSVGVALGAAGLVVWRIDARGRRDDRADPPAATIGVGPTGASVEVVF